MTLRRSPAAVGAYEVFFKEKLICFIEGVGSDARYDGDRLYWEAVFSQSVEMEVEFISVGPKSEVLAYANAIITQRTDRTFAALDRDHDDIRGKILADPRILYTFGYSWENDVLYNLAGVNLAISYVVDHAKELSDRKREVQAAWTDGLRVIQRFVQIDQACIDLPISVLDREKPQKYFTFDANKLSLNRRMLRRDGLRAASEVKANGWAIYRHINDNHDRTPGHLKMQYAYRIAASCVGNFAKTVPFVMFQGICLREFSRDMPNRVIQYHRSQMVRL